MRFRTVLSLYDITCGCVLADSQEMGVANIWLVDPANCGAFTYDVTVLHPADPTNLRVPGTPIHLDLTEAFAAIA